MKMTFEQLAELLEIPSYKVEDMYWDMVDREKLLKLINDCLVKNLTIPDVSQQRELLIAFAKFAEINMIDEGTFTPDLYIEPFLSNL